MPRRVSLANLYRDLFSGKHEPIGSLKEVQMPKYITNFGKLARKHNQPKKKAISVNEDTHEELRHLAAQTGQSLSFWADFAIRTFANNCSAEAITRYKEYQEKAEADNSRFTEDFKMKTPSNVRDLPKLAVVR